MATSTPVVEHAHPESIDRELAAALGAERVARWTTDRSVYRPEVTIVRSPDGDAAVLTSGRPNTRYTKIVEAWATTDAAAEAAVRQVIADSAARGEAGVKWELPLGDDLPAWGRDLGFEELTLPVVSATGTGDVRGFALWHTPWSHEQLTYYGQTTEFTCGAVAALTAGTAMGLEPFVREDRDNSRERELAFWRSATNFPACEPVGLAVAVHDALRALENATVDLFLDTEVPVLLESYGGEEHDYRAFLQAESRRQAAARGIPVHHEPLAIGDIVDRVRGGEFALLLIDEGLMHDASVPHWVVAHSVQGDTVLLHDPWITAKHGESWVDSHDLPVSIDVLDRMVGFGDPAYRGVIFLGRG